MAKSAKRNARAPAKARAERRFATKEQLLALATKLHLADVGGVPIEKATGKQLWDGLTDVMWREEAATDQPTPGETPTGAEMSLIRQACRSNYDIPEDELRESPAMIRALAADPKATRRDRIMAIRTLLAMREFTLAQANSMISAVTKGLEDETATRVVRTPFKPPQ